MARIEKTAVSGEGKLLGTMSENGHPYAGEAGRLADGREMRSAINPVVFHLVPLAFRKLIGHLDERYLKPNDIPQL